jgi:hypothetical protein
MTDSDSAPPAPSVSDVPAPDAPASDVPAKPRRRLPRIAAVVLVLLVAAAVGGVVAWPWLAEMLQPPPAGPTSAELAGRIATLDNDLAALRLRLGQLENRQPPVAAANDAGLERRVAALEAALAARPAAPAHLADDVKAQGDRLAVVEKNAADAATVLRLADRVDKAEAALRDLQSRRSSAGALLLAVGQLRQAVDMALPFDAELRAVKALAPPQAETEAALAALRPRAATGIPGRPALAARFTLLEPAIVRAEVLPDGDGWWPRTLNRLMTLVTVRREDGSAGGDGAAELAARAEARLAEGDFAAAVAEAGHLTGGPQAVAAQWLDDARARLAADQALTELAAGAIASSGTGP